MKTLEQQNAKAVTVAICIGMAAIALSYLTGCGTGPQGVQGPAGQVTSTSTIDPTVQAIVNNYPTNLNPGINCTVQQVTGGYWLSSSSPNYNSGQGVLVLAGSAKPYTQTNGFNQPNSSSGPNNVVAQEYQYLLTSWVNYKVTCSGFLVLTREGAYDFDVNSDDGAILSISGTTGLSASYSLNDDGTHAMTDVHTSNGSYLVPGVYNFSLQYAQSGAGAFGLVVSYYLNGAESVIPAANFYH
jgi:hypothetical protein